MIKTTFRDPLESINRNMEWLKKVGRLEILPPTDTLRKLSGTTALIRENSATKLLNKALKQTAVKSIW